MKKGLTEIVFILDRSGSMAGLEADTIGGYNSMLAKQKKEKGEAMNSGQRSLTSNRWQAHCLFFGRKALEVQSNWRSGR